MRGAYLTWSSSAIMAGSRSARRSFRKVFCARCSLVARPDAYEMPLSAATDASAKAEAKYLAEGTQRKGGRG